MSSEYEYLYSLPYEGFSGEYLHFPEAEAEALSRMGSANSEHFLGMIRECSEHPDSSAFDRCYEEAYQMASEYARKTGSSSDSGNEVIDLADAEELLYQYTKIIARFLGQPGRVTNRFIAGYTSTTTHYTHHTEYDEEGEVNREYDEYKGVDRSEHLLRFSRSRAKKILDEEYKNMLEKDPIYRPYEEFLRKEQEYAEPVHKLKDTESKIGRLKEGIHDRGKGNLILCLILAYAGWIVGSNWYVLLKRWLDTAYTGTWFRGLFSGPVLLNILHTIVKWPGAIANFYMDLICTFTVKAVGFWALVPVVLMGVFVVPFVFMVLGESFKGESANHRATKKDKKELAESKAALPALQAAASAANRAFGDMAATEDYRRTQKLNRQIADAYLRYNTTLIDSWSENRARTVIHF